MSPEIQPLIRLRTGQQASFRHPAGILGMICRRQYGKSYRLGAEAIDVMMETPGITCVFMSAAVRLGQENLRKEAEIWRNLVAKIKEGGEAITTTADDDRGDMLDADAVADLMEHSKLEVKLWHDNVTYSRSLVIAANPDTAVGFTGWLFLDEVGRMPNFRDVWEAAEPFAASNPNFKIRLATTPPPDDSHHSYEILAPPPGMEFPVNAEGNFYRSEAGILIHRVDAWDADAGGVPIYDSETREPISPDEARAKAWDKSAWDRNFACKFLKNTGQSAITATDMSHAQDRGAAAEVGIGVSLSEEIPTHRAGVEAMVRSYLSPDWARKFTGAQVGLGFDPATSDKNGSNPSSITATEKRGLDLAERLVFNFKSRDESVTTWILEILLADLERAGKRPRGLAIDASSEVFFAQAIRKRFAGRLRVHLIKSGEKLTWQGEEALAKVVLGNLYATAYADGRMLVPVGRWIAEDRRLVRRVNGTFEAPVLPDGRHADTFDSGKLAQWVLEGGAGATEAAAVSITSGHAPRPGIKNPYAHRFERRRDRRGV